MSKQFSGHFADKHPPGTKVVPELDQAIRAHLTDGQITCRQAHDIAANLHVPPLDVGVAIDLAEGRIHKCQLGLFGYGKGQKKIKAPADIPPALHQALAAALGQGRISCAEAWRIADELTLPRLTVANACEGLGIRIKPCQLGAF